MPRTLAAAVVTGLLCASGPDRTLASDLEPVEPDAIVFHDASLNVVGHTGTRAYTPAELERLGTYRLTTVTPWRDSPADFTGVLLQDVLAASGLQDIDAIRVTAENDYSVVIERDVWTRHPLLIATRVDGKAHERRQRGPLQFVFPMSTEPSLGHQSFEANWVWMAARIEPAE